MNLTEEEWKQMTQERADLLDAMQKVLAIAARHEATLVRTAEELRAAYASQSYWVGEHNKKCGMVKELEQRIKELESPLAELARELISTKTEG